VSHVLERAELKEALEKARAAGRTVALANGCFDVLHVGHVRYLEGAASEADLLVVAVNSDESVRAIKGEGRPVQPDRERAELVAALRSVDFVTVFPERDVEALLRDLRPDVHCKGTDYTPDNLPERHVARELGIRIAIVGDPKDHASSDLLRRMRG
jgi:rfaE bifunctional protein nucleotidyltransferase chain/domain